MNDRDLALLLGELIEADEGERTCLEQRIRQHGLDGFLRNLGKDSSFSAETLEKLRAVQGIVSKTWPERKKSDG
ncbi:hypothetical protein FRY98_03585 [Paenibacillus faecis]|uniref:Uncharacterized protein n=1 Tax=Paenibacillus faecis TaxID=862114 RepID=A0A5D0CYI6_9BACL|nr:hypothetical protein [Paenibacillus faecis]TYA14770.1 hypothetical protein FRY98_03585 [Paenibacillus faecis]